MVSPSILSACLLVYFLAGLVMEEGGDFEWMDGLIERLRIARSTPEVMIENPQGGGRRLAD